MRKFTLLLSIVIISESIFGQKQILGFNLMNGTTYYHTMQSSSSIKEDINGQNINMDMTISGKIAYRVKNFKDTVYDMDVTYEELAMTMKLPDREMTFNSNKKDENDIYSTILG